MTPRLQDERGFALILTVLMVSLMVVLTLQFQRQMRAEVGAAAAFRDRVQLLAVARSGVRYAMARLSADAAATSSDTLLEPWADPSRLAADAARLYEAQDLRLDIFDLSARVQLNRLVDSAGQPDPQQLALLRRLLASAFPDLDSSAVEALLDALKDWIDPDDAVTGAGAESAFYRTLDPPRTCRNGPLVSIEELLLVKGFRPELLQGDEGRPGLAELLSIHGDGRINLNLAEPAVLQALSESLTEERLSDLLAFRRHPDNDLSDPAWYRRVPGLEHLNLAPALLTTQSTHFEIRSHASRGPLSRRVTAVVRRERPDRLELLSWKVE